MPPRSSTVQDGRVLNWSVVLSALAAVLNLSIAAMFGFAITGIWGQAKDIGSITEKISRIENRLDSIDGSIKQVEQQLAQRDTDPAKLLVANGVPVNNQIGSAFIKGTSVLFPKSSSVEAELAQAGYEKVQITPMIYGYVRRDDVQEFGTRSAPDLEAPSQSPASPGAGPPG